MTGLPRVLSASCSLTVTLIYCWIATVMYFMYFCSVVYLTVHQILLDLISATFLPLDEEIASRVIFVIVSWSAQKQ